MLKLVFKKILVILILAITLMTSTNIIPTALAVEEIVEDAIEGIIEEDIVEDTSENASEDTIEDNVESVIEDEIVNLGVAVKLVTANQNLKTGEINKVTVKSSYSNPNDGENAHVRLYLWDYKDGTKKTPSSEIEVMNLVDGKIIYALENNADLSVVVSLIETETEKYLEYELPAGSSAEMELEFKVANGLYDNAGIILEPVIISPEADNNQVDEPITLTWTGDFGWENLYVASNVENLTVTSNKAFNSHLEFIYSATDMNLTDVNEIWTDYIEFENTLTFPETISLSDLHYKKDENGNFTSSLYDSEGNEIYKFSMENFDYTISNIEIKDNTIKLNGKIENPYKENDVLTSEFNPITVNDIVLILDTTRLYVSDDYTSWGGDNIKNDLKCTFYPCAENVESITLNNYKEVFINPDSTVLSVSKKADKTTAKYEDKINYEVTLNNDTRYEKTEKVWDILPNGMHLTSASRKQLKDEGYKVGNSAKLVDDATINSKQVNYSGDNYWDTTDALAVNYPVGKNFDLHSGVKVMFDVNVPADFDIGYGRMLGFIGFSMGDDWSKWVQAQTSIDFSSAKTNGSYKTVPVCVEMPDDCLNNGILQNASVTIIGSGAEYHGEMQIGNFKIYDGIVEVPEVSDNLEKNENVVYSNYTKTDEYYSDTVNFSSSDWWDDDEFSLTENLGGMENTLTEDTRVSFDLYMPSNYQSSKIFTLVAIQGNSDWSGWIQTQGEFLYTDFKNTYSSDGYKVHVEMMMPDGVDEFDVLQNIVIKVIGSATYASGTVKIKNLKLYSVGASAYPNTLEKEIVLAPNSTQRINYSTIVNTKGTTSAGNIATIGTGDEYHTDKTTVTIKELNEAPVSDGDITIDKEITERYDSCCDTTWNTENDPYIVSSGKYESELNVLGEGDVIFYTATLSNGTAVDKTYTISDYSPLYGSYHALNSYLYWYKYTQISGLKDCYAMYGKDTQIFNGSEYIGIDTIISNEKEYYTDFKDNMISELDKTTDGKYTFTITIPANTEFKQTFILQVPNGDAYKKYEEVVRSYLAHNSGDYDVRNEPISINSYNGQIVYNIQWVPHSTIIIEGTSLYKSLRHTLERKYSVTNYALGQDSFYDYKAWYTKNNTYGLWDNNTIDNDLAANYWVRDTYNLTNSGNQYMLYGVTIFNDSTEPLFMNNTRLFIELPEGVEFCEFALASGSENEKYGEHFYSLHQNGSGRDQSNKFITLKDKYGNQYNITQREKAGWGAQAFRYQDSDTVEIDLMGASSYWYAYNYDAQVQPNYSDEYYYNMNFRCSYLQPYQTMTAYYVLKIKDDNVNMGNIETTAILDVANVYDVHKSETSAEYAKEVYDNNRIEFNTSGEYPWTQKADGTWESGAKGVNNGISTMTSSEFTLNKAGKLKFDWALSSEYNFDYIICNIKDLNTNSIYRTLSSQGINSGTVYKDLNFQTVEIDLPVGRYTVEFIYRKDSSVSNYLDAGFIRNVKINSENNNTIRFNSLGEYPWIQKADRTWESGAKGVNNGISTMTSSEFTLNKAGKLKFDWALSSEYNWDYIICNIKNLNTNSTYRTLSSQGMHSGTIYKDLNFQTVEIDLPVGRYTVEFIYRKDGSASNYLDAGFIRNIEIPGYIVGDKALIGRPSLMDYTSKYTSYYDSTKVLASTVIQNISYSSDANIYNSVIGRNSYTDIKNGKGVANVYHKDMNKFLMNADEVVTFGVVVANGDNEEKVNNYTVNVDLPEGLEFIGCHTISENAIRNIAANGYRVSYTWDNIFDFRNVIVTDYTITGTTSAAPHEYALSNLITDGQVDGSLINGQKNGYSFFTCNPKIRTKDNMVNTGKQGYTNYYTFSNNNDSLEFSVTQSGGTATYIIYSCKVNTKSEEEITVTNTANLTTRNNKLSYFEEMDYAPYYNSSYTGTHRFNIDGQNITKGIDKKSYITAPVTLTGIPKSQSIHMEKTLISAYDKDNLVKHNAYYECYNKDDATNNYIALGTDGQVLGNYVGDNGNTIKGTVLDGGINMLYYSPVDGIHNTNWYRDSVVWNVRVNNNGLGNVDVSKIVEEIDDPFKLYGYSLMLYDDRGALIGAFTINNDREVMDPDYTTVEYNSQVTGEDVTRNVYNINLVEDLKKLIETNPTSPTLITTEYTDADLSNWDGKTFTDYLIGLPENYSYDLFLYSDMTEEKLDWYYSTTTLQLDNVNNFTFLLDENPVSKEITTNEDITTKLEGLQETSFLSVLASDGIKSIEKYDLEDDYNVNSKTNTVYSTKENEQIVNYTLEMGSYLYQTKYYQNGALKNITFYDLLPGYEYGGLDADEVGGGYTVNTDSFSAYILKTDGSKVNVDPSHFKVMYSRESLHGGRHPISVDDDTLYNVDFAKAADESIWLDEYNKDCRSFRVVFDNTVELANADRLYVDFNVTMRDDTFMDQEYHNVFGYIYDCVNTDYPNKTLRLYEDTVDIKSTDESPKVMVTKYVYDAYGNRMEELPEEEDVEYEFGLYSYTGSVLDITEEQKIATFKLKANESIRLTKVFEGIGIDDNTITGNFAIIEEDNDFAGLIKIKSESDKNTTFGRVENGNIFTFTASNYKSFLNAIANVTFTNKVKVSGKIQLKKVDENGDLINFKNTSVTYKVHDENGQNVKFELKDGEYFYNKNGEIEEITVTNNTVNLYYLPYGNYTIEEVVPPANYIGLAEEKPFVIENRNNMIIDIVNQKISTNNLSIEKIDSSTENIIDETYGNANFKVMQAINGRYQNVTLVDLGINEEKGHMYTFNTNDSEETVSEISTYKGKIYLENVTGNLKFTETKTPLGYSIINYSGDTFTYSPTVKEATMKIKNRKSSVDKVFLKKSFSTNEILDKVAFSVYQKDNEEPCKLIKTGNTEYSYGDTIYTIPVYRIVNSSYEGDDVITVAETNVGMLKIENIPNSTYKLKEVLAPDGYVLEENLIDIAFSSNSQTIINKPNIGFVEFTKVDDKNNVILEPVTFEVYDSNDNKIRFNLYDYNESKGCVYEYSEYGNTTEINTYNGMIFLKKLPIGKYKVIETKSIENFELQNGYYEFTVSGTNVENNPLKVKVVNIPTVGDAEFTKVDTRGNIITGVTKFNIIDSNGNKVKFTNVEGKYIPSEDGTEELCTIEGKVIIDNLNVGSYTLKEIETPEEYTLRDDISFEITKENYYTALKMNVENRHAYGELQIDKYNANGEIITSSPAVFMIYDENDNGVSFDYKDETGENGRIYTYTKETGNTTRLTTDNGKIFVKKLPVGEYYLKEVAAPNGYSLYEGKIRFSIGENSLYTATRVAVTNPDYIYGSEEYVSSSYQKIEEKDNSDNYGYGYFGKESDYEAGNRNYIFVDDKEDRIRYTLVVGNMSKKNFERLVLIDKLPEIGDTGVINLNKERGSEFTVKLAENPNYDIYVLDNNGERVETPGYRIEFTDDIAFTEADFDGNVDENKWYAEPKESTKAFRIVLADGFVLPSTYKIAFEFDGKAQDNAKPGLIAWNSFGYRYYVGDIKLSPEPPKVGLKIPTAPKLTKLVEDDIEGKFEFEIYEKLADETLSLVKTISVKTNETVELEMKRIINGEESGYLEAGKDYVIKEKDSKQFKQIHVEGVNGKAYAVENGEVFEFRYDMDTETSVTFTNAEKSIGQVQLTKKDVATNEVLKGAEFELRDNDGNALNIKNTESGYVYTKSTENSETKLYTDENGIIKISGLPYGEYNLCETKAPEGYICGTENSYKFTINDDVIEMDENGKCTVKTIELNATNESTKVKIEKYFDQTIKDNEFSGKVEGALLQIWNEDKTIMYHESTTDESGGFEVSNLPIGKLVLVEKTAPNTFAKANDVYFEITNEGKVLIDGKEVKDETIKMKDEIVTGNIIINKKGNVLQDVGIIEKIKGFFMHIFNWITGNLENVSFEIHASEDIYVQDKLIFEKDQLIDTITTDKLGIAKLDGLPLGDYYAVEVKTEQNHEIDKTPISLSLEYKNQDMKVVVCEKTVVNERKNATIYVHKIDANDGNIKLEGAVFGIYQKADSGFFKKDELLAVAVTDKDGSAMFDVKLPVGTYYIKELEAPKKYILSDKVEEFTFEETEIFEFTFTNKKIEEIQDNGYIENAKSEENKADSVDSEVKEQQSVITEANLNIKTGDNIIAIIVILVIALGTFIVLTIWKKNKEN